MLDLAVSLQEERKPADAELAEPAVPAEPAAIVANDKVDVARAQCRGALQGLAGLVGEPMSYHIVGSSLRMLQEEWCIAFVLQTPGAVEACAGAVMAIALSMEPSLPAHISRASSSCADFVVAPAFASAEHFLLRLGNADPTQTKRILIGMLTAMARRPT